MHWFWWVIISLFVLLVLATFAKITVNLTYFHNQDNDELTIKLSTFYGLASYTVNVPVLKIDNDSPAIVVKEEQHSAINETEKTEKITPETIIRDLRHLRDFLKHVIGFHKIMKKLLSRISITKFSWKSVIGTGDAAFTGSCIGALWGVKGSILGMISHYMRLKVYPIIEVQPHFQKLTSHTELACIFSFRLGYAIIAALQIVKYWKKLPKTITENLYEQNGI